MPARSIRLALPVVATAGSLVLAEVPLLHILGASGAVLISTIVAHWRRPPSLAHAHDLLSRLSAHEAHALRLHRALDAELQHLSPRVATPATASRQERLQALRLSVVLGIGDRLVPASLRDLTLHDLYVDLPALEPQRWSIGMPARVTLHHNGTEVVLGWATAHEALRTPEYPDQTWRLVWRRPLRPDELPGPVRRATIARDAHRVAAHPAARVALCDGEGARAAEIVDLSADGIGLRVPLGLRDAGRLGRWVRIELTLPMADPMQMGCEVCHMDVRASGTLVGLRFDPQATGFAEHQARIAAHVMRRDAHTFIRLVRAS